MALTACSEDGPASKIAGQAPKALEGTSWQLVTGEAKSASGDCENLPPLMTFMPDSRVAGNLGCNRFTGGYKIDGKTFQFGDKLASTRMMCAPEAIKMEERMTAIIAQTRFMTQDDKGLMLWNEKGELLAQFEPEVPGACQ